MENQSVQQELKVSAALMVACSWLGYPLKFNGHVEAGDRTLGLNKAGV